MPKQNGQGEAESYTESGEEEAKGGENVQKINREDVVQSALTVERWCREHRKGDEPCDCPFEREMTDDKKSTWYSCEVECRHGWNLEEFLRTRGLKHD